MEATPPDDLDERSMLAAVAEHRDLVALLEVEQLEWVLRWAYAHPALGEGGVLSADEHPGGEGTPGVAAFTAEPLAGALRVSPASAQGLLADALDLSHRLPKVWDQVRALEVAVWKARRIAKATRDLPLEAARWVDRQLIGAAGSIGAAALDRLLALAVARVDPDAAKRREEAERSRWDVTLKQPRDWAGTSELTAVGDTVALGEVLAHIDAEAEALAEVGDEDPAGVRRVKALVSLARHGAGQLALGFGAEEAGSAKAKGGAVRPALQLYVHTSLADLATLAAGVREGCDEGPAEGVPVAEVERFGPVTSELLKRWLNQTHGRCRVTVTPVLDLADATWSPRHDPPPRMRRQVVLRHRSCVFPFCGRDARSGDLDHIVPWEPDDPSGPGTTADNLAPLCRRHHRAKTDGRWRYDAIPDPVDGSARAPDHLWTGPHGQVFLVSGGRTVQVGSPSG